MPRGGPPTYTYSLPAIYLAIPGTLITAAQHNTPLEDIASTLNTAWPVNLGGTGGTSKQGAIDSLFDGTTYISDADFRLAASADPTKLLAFNLSGITTATTQTITVPDASGTLVLKDSSGNVTGIEDFTQTGIFTHDGTSGDITMAATGADITFSRNGPNAVQALGGTSATLDLKGYNGINFGTGSSGTTNGRVDSSGNLLIGKIAIDDSTSGATIRANGQASLTANASATILSYRYTSDGEIQRFHRNSSAVGNISVTASATAYNTSSDYRLPWKVGAEPLTGSGLFIDSLKPYYFPVVGHAGFFAHEFAEVSAISVTGEKDAVDEEGQPVYQSMQASTADVIANLVAEIQSLRVRLAALETA